MTKALPSVLATKADFKTYFRNVHLEKNRQFGRRRKGDIHTTYVPPQEPDLGLNWCSLITNLHLDKSINFSDLQGFFVGNGKL